MRQYVLLAILVILAFPAFAEKRMALLIGNETYNTAGLSALQSPHEDVERIANALRQADFTDVVVLKDQNEPEMRESILAFSEKLRAAGEEAVGFFYYSGHGAALDKEDGTRVSYFIPTGVPVSYAEQLESYGVPIGEQVDRLSSTGAGAVFVVIDACRNSLAYKYRKSSGVKGIGRVAAPSGLLIAFAAAEGQWADDDSVFSEALAEEIPKPGQSAETAFLNAARVVGTKKPGLERLPVIQPRLTKSICFNECDSEQSTFQDYVDAAAAARDRNYKVAMPLFERACEGDHYMACTELGLIYSTVLGTFSDQVKSRSLYWKSCDGGDAMGCNNLGVLFQYGKGGEINLSEAKRFFRRACDGNNRLGCSNLALMFREGIGGRRNPVIARELMARACDLEDASSCGDLGYMLYEGEGGEVDKAEGMRLLELSCGDGVQQYCNAFRDRGGLFKQQK